jgi:hypothetical protein
MISQINTAKEQRGIDIFNSFLVESILLYKVF